MARRTFGRATLVNVKRAWSVQVRKDWHHVTTHTVYDGTVTDSDNMVIEWADGTVTIDGSVLRDFGVATDGLPRQYSIGRRKCYDFNDSDIRRYVKYQYEYPSAPAARERKATWLEINRAVNAR